MFARVYGWLAQPARARQIRRVLIFLALIWLVVASYNFMLMELKYGKISFLGLHSGWLVGIIPFGFSMMAIRFLNIFLQSFSNEGEK